MPDSRRDFVFALAGAGGCFALMPAEFMAQVKWPRPPRSSQSPEPDAPIPRQSSKAVLTANGEEVKKNVQQLYDLISAMKAEVDAADPAEVFSVRLYKEAERIEKLAKQIKNRVRS